MLHSSTVKPSWPTRTGGLAIPLLRFDLAVGVVVDSLGPQIRAVDTDAEFTFEREA